MIYGSAVHFSVQSEHMLRVVFPMMTTDDDDDDDDDGACWLW